MYEEAHVNGIDIIPNEKESLSFKDFCFCSYNGKDFCYTLKKSASRLYLQKGRAEGTYC